MVVWLERVAAARPLGIMPKIAMAANAITPMAMVTSINENARGFVAIRGIGKTNLMKHNHAFKKNII